MRVLVCGGRDFHRHEAARLLDLELIWSLRDHFGQCGSTVDLIIHGGAKGADTGAGDWAKANNIPVKVFRADWDQYKKAAGPIRNRTMLLEGKPDVVVALRGGRGTSDMIKQAVNHGVPVVKITTSDFCFGDLL